MNENIFFPFGRRNVNLQHVRPNVALVVVALADPGVARKDAHLARKKMELHVARHARGELPVITAENMINSLTMSEKLFILSP